MKVTKTNLKTVNSTHVQRLTSRFSPKHYIIRTISKYLTRSRTVTECGPRSSAVADIQNGGRGGNAAEYFQKFNVKICVFVAS